MAAFQSRALPQVAVFAKDRRVVITGRSDARGAPRRAFNRMEYGTSIRPQYVADAVHGMCRARAERLHGVRRRGCNADLKEPPALRPHHRVLPGAFTVPALLGRRAHQVSVVSGCRVDASQAVARTTMREPPIGLPCIVHYGDAAPFQASPSIPLSRRERQVAL